MFVVLFDLVSKHPWLAYRSKTFEYRHGHLKHQFSQSIWRSDDSGLSVDAYVAHDLKVRVRRRHDDSFLFPSKTVFMYVY